MMAKSWPPGLKRYASPAAASNFEVLRVQEELCALQLPGEGEVGASCERRGRRHAPYSGSFVEAPPCEKEKGEQLFKDKCASCHTLGADEGHGSGPNLHGLFGRISGTAEGYQFSPPIRIKRLIWDEEALYRFLFDPQKFIHPSLRIPCTKVPDSKQRADLVCYLREAAGEYKLDRRPL